MSAKRSLTLSWVPRLCNKKRLFTMRFLPILGVILFHASVISAATPNDSYIAGYADAILKQDLKHDIPSLVVRNGIITVPVGHLTPEVRKRILHMLSQIPGVAGVMPEESADEQIAAATSGITTQSHEELQDPVQESMATSSISSAPVGQLTPTYLPESDTPVFATGFLPKGHLFKPLLADPRWAHFSAAYRNYIGNNIDGNNNGAVSFGETLPFYRANIGTSIVQWETGIQAAVFSDFNLGAPSADLINTDFIASLYASVRARKFSAFGRIYHQSSHLGDEFLLRTSLERINLSYEGADLKLSYELPYGLRVYGGGGGIFHKEPSTLKPWLIHYGIEFRSPWRVEVASMRPVFAVDLKNWEQNNWNTDVSARAGIQFDNFQTFGRKFQLLVEYFNGNSPTGQFYKEKVEYMGIGAHYHF